MSGTPTATPGLRIVGYGLEGSKSFPQPMLLLVHDLTRAKNPALFAPLVRESDALAAIEAARDAPVPMKNRRIERDKLLAERYDMRGFAKGLRCTIAALTAERDALRATAIAVVDRWDSPLWKYAEPTAVFINRLRAAIAINGGDPAPVAGDVL